MPALTYSVAGQLGGETEGDALLSPPALACAADLTVPGVYPITLTGGTAGENYMISARIDAVLLVTERPAVTVTFLPNLGSGTVTWQTADYGATVRLAANTFVRSGYRFAGWNTAADGSGSFYAEEAEIRLDADITLFAQWERDEEPHISTRPAGGTGGGTGGGSGSSSGGGSGGTQEGASDMRGADDTAPAGGPEDVPLPETAEAATVRRFTDVTPEDWYCDAVAHCARSGYLDGLPGTRFDPNAPMGRAAFVSLLYTMAGRQEETAASGFTDCEDGAPYSAALGWAAAEGLVNGYGGGRFCPDAPVTREALVVLLWRTHGRPAAPPDSLASFSDTDALSPWAREAMAWAVGAGIIVGRGGGILAPGEDATRAEAAQILWRYDLTFHYQN